ncbi:MAG: hypothetical protein J6J79_01420 [Lachnospiraceae bacterium]|nr:hypothetical protein [Lachnospiraceae bacterium]
MVIKNGETHIVYAKDTTKNMQEIYGVLERALGDAFNCFEYRKNQKVATGRYTNSRKESYYFIVANITFMGGKEGQHSLDLKRIQYNKMWRDFYNEFSSKGKVLWLGLYSYNDINIFGIFEPETYLHKHAGKSMISKGGHKANYSCHIFLNDLFQGHQNGYYSKKDKNGNIVGAISKDKMKNYFDKVSESGNPIITTIEAINQDYIDWNEWIRADRAITYMRSVQNITGFGQWKQNLWNGWYIEALYSDYLHNHSAKYVDYIATTKNENVKKEYSASGLDLAFPTEPYHFIGDLKAVCEGDGNTLLNDERKVKAALEKYKKIWFVIYIHNKKQGSTNNYEMVKWRNHYILDQGEWKPSEKHPEFDEMSAPRTPHSVEYTEMIIIELNEITKEKYFSIGAQWGVNSDGNDRNDKFKVNKKMLKEINDDSFVIYRKKF